MYGSGMNATPCHFESVVGAWPGTAASATGIVVRVDDQETPDRWHEHCDFHALYVVRRGRGIHVVDGVPYGVARGDVYAMGVGAVHAYSQHEDLCLDAIYYRPDALSEVERRTLAGTPGFVGTGKWQHLGPGAYAGVRVQFEELRREWSRSDESGALMARSLFVRLLVTLARTADGAPPTGKTPAATAVADAVRMLDERHGRPLRIAEIAREVGLCPDHLTEAFAATMGRTPRDYLRHVRIERAKALLERSALPVGEIAVGTGFSDAPHFTRTFRDSVGVTPSAYRMRFRREG